MGNNLNPTSQWREIIGGLGDEKIISCLLHDYGLKVVQIAFLPVGADPNTAAYWAMAEDDTPYFVKLRRGAFDETSVALPKFLSDQGIEQIIPPLTTQTGQLRANLDTFKVILYPFVKGRNGYEVKLTERHWRELGAALKKIHAAEIPPALIRRIERETFSPQWREIVRTFLERGEDKAFDDPLSARLAAFLKTKRDEILDLVERAERLARALQARSPEFILCHSDLHAGNVLIDPAADALYIVDWDAPSLAPKERDLMFVGAGLMGNGYTPQQEEILFYRGYGQTQLDPIGLAYFRYERIVQDIAVFCQQIFLTNEGSEDREQSFQYLTSNFLPNGTIAIAYESDMI